MIDTSSKRFWSVQRIYERDILTILMISERSQWILMVSFDDSGRQPEERPRKALVSSLPLPANRPISSLEIRPEPSTPSDHSREVGHLSAHGEALLTSPKRADRNRSRCGRKKADARYSRARISHAAPRGGRTPLRASSRPSRGYKSHASTPRRQYTCATTTLGIARRRYGWTPPFRPQR